MTAEVTPPAYERPGSVSLEAGRQGNRRAGLEAVGLLLGIMVILLVVTLVIGVTPPGA